MFIGMLTLDLIALSRASTATRLVHGYSGIHVDYLYLYIVHCLNNCEKRAPL